MKQYSIKTILCSQQELTEYMKKHNTLKGFTGCEEKGNPSDLLYEECDILVPAAIEKVITKNGAEKVKAKVRAYYL